MVAVLRSCPSALNCKAPSVFNVPSSSAAPPACSCALVALSVPDWCRSPAACAVSAPFAATAPSSMRSPRLRRLVAPRWLPSSPLLANCAASTRNASPATRLPPLRVVPLLAMSALRPA